MASQGQASDAYPSSVPDGDQIEYPAFDFPQDVLGTQEWVEGAQAKQSQCQMKRRS
jgi:hypothetical protein